MTVLVSLLKGMLSDGSSFVGVRCNSISAAVRARSTVTPVSRNPLKLLSAEIKPNIR